MERDKSSRKNLQFHFPNLEQMHLTIETSFRSKTLAARDSGKETLGFQSLQICPQLLTFQQNLTQLIIPFFFFLKSFSLDFSDTEFTWVSTYLFELSTQSLLQSFFLCLVLKWGVHHSYYAPGPLSFLILHAFLKDNLICVHFSSYHLFPVDIQVCISNTYFSLAFQTYIANSLLKLCVLMAKHIHHVKK